MDTRASPAVIPATSASSASRNKSTASPSAAHNASVTLPGTMPQPSSSSAGPATSSRAPRNGTSHAPASLSKGAADEARPTRHSSHHSLKRETSIKRETSVKLDDPPKPNKNDLLLQAYRSDFDGLRTLLTCKICDRLLYEPYTIACGHIYCYSCLSQWFSGNRNKTCPDCRASVTQAPAPTYLVREMVLIFINRAESLPTGETVEEHVTWQKEEAEIVKKDRENADPRTGGLFKGAFNRNGGNVIYALRDSDDGVDRCPLCGWELEDGECERCGLEFDENGVAYNGSSMTFSEDETSEQGISSEDFDADMGDDDYGDEGDYPNEIDVDAFGDYWGDEWDLNYGDDEPAFRVRRWLAHGGALNAPLAMPPRRRAAHSAAGSRRRYSASLASDMITEDMETLEEEDEDDIDEDSSMNDFIDDGQTEDGTQVSNSTSSETPQPPTSRRSPPRRNRRVVESETSSSVSQATEDDDDDDDDDEEDEGPIRPGRRRQPIQSRTLARANGSRGGTASSTSTDASLGRDLEEDTQALLLEAGWSPLNHDGSDDMDEDEDDSDGGRTTVGWEPTANSNNRVSVSIPLTPSADRLSHQNRPNSRVGGRRPIPDGSRGLRRRSSVLSTSTVHYEDGEADDDDSEIDRDGDTNMSGSNNLRARASRVRLREQNQQPSRIVNRGMTPGDAIDLDTDDNSDTSVIPARRANARPRQREYDPRISLLFANHQVIMRELDLPEPFRATTPLARPRTANRNRMSAQSPSIPPASPASRPSQSDSRPPSIPTGASAGPGSRRGSVDVPPNQPTSTPSSRSERSTSVASTPHTEGTGSESGARTREVSVESTNSGSTITAATAVEGQAVAHGIPQSVTAGPLDVIERPMSRLSSGRPPSASGRRASGGFGLPQGFPMSQGVGLNFAQRTAYQAQTRNPYWSAIPPAYPAAPRPRQSRQTLREQSSTATLRPRNSQRGLRSQGSRADVREAPAANQGVRSPPSQFNLRSQPSVRRLNSQPSARALRAAHGVPASPTAASNASRLSEDERRRRVDEMLRSRAEALRSTNPFNVRRQDLANASNAAQAATRAVPTGTTGTGVSASTSVSTQAVGSHSVTPTSPTLGRRRSNRSIGLPSGAFVNIQNSNYIRTRSGQMYGSSLEGSISPIPASVSSPVAAAGYTA